MVILAYVIKTEIFDRRRGVKKRETVIQEKSYTNLGRQYARLTRALARLGLPRRPSETPGEYAARALPFLIALERDWGFALPPVVVQDLSAAFAAACYGSPGDPAFETRDWEQAVAPFDAAARRIGWLRLWRRVTGRASAKTIPAGT